MTYKISKQTLKDRKKNLLILMIFMPIMMAAFSYIYAQQGGGLKNVKLYAMIIAGASAFIVLEVYVVGKIMFKKIASMAIIFDDQGFDRVNGKKTERFDFCDLKDLKITTVENLDHKMILRGKCGQKAFVLGGFEDMPGLANRFEGHGETIHRKHKKIDWTNPKVSLVIMPVVFLIFALLITVGDAYTDYISPLIQLIMGLWFLLFKPISRNSGARFKKMEYGLGGLLVVLSGMIILINLLT